MSELCIQAQERCSAGVVVEATLAAAAVIIGLSPPPSVRCVEPSVTGTLEDNTDSKHRNKVVFTKRKKTLAGLASNQLTVFRFHNFPKLLKRLFLLNIISWEKIVCHKGFANNILSGCTIHNEGLDSLFKFII
jgi:hypothetical protein